MIAFSTWNTTVIIRTSGYFGLKSVVGVPKTGAGLLLLTRPPSHTVPLILNPPILSAINGILILRLQLL
jgi:hypothetical protein